MNIVPEKVISGWGVRREVDFKLDIFVLDFHGQNYLGTYIFPQLWIGRGFY